LFRLCWLEGGGMVRILSETSRDTIHLGEIYLHQMIIKCSCPRPLSQSFSSVVLTIHPSCPLQPFSYHIPVTLPSPVVNLQTYVPYITSPPCLCIIVTLTKFKSLLDFKYLCYAKRLILFLFCSMARVLSMWRIPFSG